MAQSMINFRIDEDIKKNMEQTCKNMGITMSSAFTMFAVTVIREQRIPFEIVADPFYSASNMQLLEQRAKDAAQGINMSEHELIED